MADRETKKTSVAERVQTGIRMERRILKVLKATAELIDVSVGDLMEDIVLNAFDGKTAFAPDTLKQIGEFKAIYGLNLQASSSRGAEGTKKRSPRAK
jgi:hypothetical protein